MATIEFNYRSAGTASKWEKVPHPPTGAGPDPAGADSAHAKLTHALSDILLSENLVVLSGLGTSLCILDGTKRLAPTMGDLWKAAKAKLGADFDKIVAKVKYKTPADGYDNIELLLSRCLNVQKLEFQADVKDFIEKAEGVIVDACNFIKPGISLQTHETFLRKVARRSTRLPRMKLFTTNYDLAFETAASSMRFIAIDGFSHTHPQEFDGTYFNYDVVERAPNSEQPSFIQNVFQLGKMHGSLDWEQTTTQIIRRPNPPRPLIIYPRDSKFETSYDQPFFEIMSRFQSALRLPNTGLIVVGFGFNDAHISEPIYSSIRANVGLRVAIVDPALTNKDNKVTAKLSPLIDAGDWRIHLIANTFEDFVSLLPDLTAKTEEERHLERLRKIGK